jgi:hypothetical protein
MGMHSLPINVSGGKPIATILQFSPGVLDILKIAMALLFTSVRHTNKIVGFILF